MFKEQEKKTKLAKATYLGPKDANDKSGKLLTLVLSYHYICMSLSITLHEYTLNLKKFSMCNVN